MQLTLSSDSIYQGSICRLTASAHNQFNLSTNTKTLAYVKGSPSDISIVSTDDKDKHQIEITLLNTIKEKSTSYSDSGSSGSGSSGPSGLQVFRSSGLQVQVLLLNME